MTSNRLLVVDDDNAICALFAEVATHVGFEAETLTDPVAVGSRLAEFDPDVLLLDLQMPGRDGIEVIRSLGAGGCRAAIFITSGLDNRVLATAEQLGLSVGLNIVGTINKPIDIAPLADLLSPLLKEDRQFTPDELSAAIEMGQLVVHYLPKVTHRGGSRWTLEGAEALVRWQHPEYGLVYPQEFLACAESSGLIVQLTDFVFRSAMEQASVWLHRQLYIELGLNLSATFLSDLEFPDRFLKLVREHSLDPSMVALELTETSDLVDLELALDVMTRMRVKHVSLVLDDFGVGKSTLTHLYRMPFNEVKLDISFIRDMRTSDDAQKTVHGLIELAHKLNIGACAEGVEDEATFRMLEAMGCDKMQGHYIGSAMPGRNFEELVREWNARHGGESVSKLA